MTPYFSTPERQAQLVRAARSWEGTPCMVRQAVRGVAVDCVHLVAEVMRECGVIESYAFGRYSLDRGQHREDSLLTDWLNASPAFDLMPPVVAIQAGDVVVFKVGRSIHHCGVMIDELRFIHCIVVAGSIEGRLDDPTYAPPRAAALYRPIEH